MTEYSSLSKYLSKNVQFVIQVVNNKKVMAKTPREANLYGNWESSLSRTFCANTFVKIIPPDIEKSTKRLSKFCKETQMAKYYSPPWPSYLHSFGFHRRCR